MKYYNIIVSANVKKLLVYQSTDNLKSGIRVIIPLKNRYVTGIVLNEIINRPNFTTKEIFEVIDTEPKITEELLNLAKWMSNYYHTSINSILKLFFPIAEQIQFQKKIRLLDEVKEEDFPNGIPELYEILKNKCWIDIELLNQNKTIPDFYKLMESLEKRNIIEIERSFDKKIKNKYENRVFFVKDADEEIHLTSKQLNLFLKIKEKNVIKLSEIAKEYSYSVVKALRNKELVKIVPVKVENEKRPFFSKSIKKKVELNQDQKKVFEKILKKVEENTYKTFLLYGVTGSGKTEIYIKLIEKTISMNKTVLMLVPEISLTPQMEKRFYSEFGDRVGLIHSHLNERERWDEWKKIVSGKCSIVIGVRSAVFSPLKNIGLIIVDEEHENSYKQGNNPRYNARDVAIYRGNKNNAVVVLGSATPSLESWNNAESGKYELLKLAKRNGESRLPVIRIIDMKIDNHSSKIFSNILLEKIQERLVKKEQIIIFQNRRGYSSFVQCTDCGKLLKCPNCEISLNYHKVEEKVVCHYCGYTIDLPRKCPDCGGYHFKFGSPGTEQVELKLKSLFPNAKIMRMDSDTATKKDSYKNMFNRMKNGSVDILLGTQMIAKGLDFANVTLVGIISADSILNIPDFRASERTFQLLTQVAGRAGRGLKDGEVIIQTYNPEHYAIINSKEQNFISFSKKELYLRKMLNYPPFNRLTRILFIHEDNKILLDLKKKLDLKLKKFKEDNKSVSVIFLGPIEAPIPKINLKLRYHLIIKTKTFKQMDIVLRWFERNIKISNTIKISIDVDPLSLL